MSIAFTNTHRFTPTIGNSQPILFEIKRVQLEKACLTHQSHRSEHYKIFFVEQGAGRYTIDFHDFHIQDSGIFCLSPDQVLTVQSESISSAYQIVFDRDFYCVETHGKEIACNGVLFNNVHRATYIPLELRDIPVFLEILDKLIEELNNPGTAHQVMLETYLKLFMINALRRQKIDTSVISSREYNGGRLVADFIALVDKHFRDVHSVARYAEKLHVSPKSLAKRLNAQGYKTPTEIIRDRIVLEAKRDLLYSGKSVKEIAFSLGFDDPAYFTRYFKKASNQAPSQYKQLATS